MEADKKHKCLSCQQDLVRIHNCAQIVLLSMREPKAGWERTWGGGNGTLERMGRKRATG